MRSARRLYRIQLTLAGLGVGVALLAVGVAARALSWGSPSLEALAAACRSFALPELTAASTLLLVVASVSLAAGGLGARSAWRQLRARRRFMRSLRVLGPAPAAAPGASALLFEDASPHAFCTGFLRPRVYLSTAAVELLGIDELRAVLAHEAHHVRRRDPLRIFVARTFADALFFLPVLSRMAARYEALAEIAADEAALRQGHDRRPLAEALLAFEQSPTPAVVGIAPERVDHLLGCRPRWELPVALVAGGLLTLVAALAVVLRLAEATAHTSVNLPLVVAQACMLVMALAPPVAGAVLVLASRRALRRRAR